MSDATRRRRSNSIIYTEPPETIEQSSDQAALPNLNASWVNSKGTVPKPPIPPKQPPPQPYTSPPALSNALPGRRASSRLHRTVARRMTVACHVRLVVQIH